MVQQPPTESDCKQSDLLNLSTLYKHNDVVIVNSNYYKENMKIHIHIPAAPLGCLHQVRANS